MKRYNVFYNGKLTDMVIFGISKDDASLKAEKVAKKLYLNFNPKNLSVRVAK